LSETVTVTEVGPTNQWGYAEVKFAERGPAKTKSTEIIARATEMQGQAAPAVIAEVTNAKGFTNVYLNEFAGIKDKPTKSSGNGGQKTTPVQSQGDSGLHQAAAHALGRAVETLIGSGVEYPSPLDEKTLKAVEQDAAAFLAIKNRLAGA
jgi:hypothetical protein